MQDGLPGRLYAGLRSRSDLLREVRWPSDLAIVKQDTALVGRPTRSVAVLSVVVAAIDDLPDKNLAVRTRDAADRRRSLVSITDICHRALIGSTVRCLTSAIPALGPQSGERRDADGGVRPRGHELRGGRTQHVDVVDVPMLDHLIRALATA